MCGTNKLFISSSKKKFFKYRLKLKKLLICIVIIEFMFNIVEFNDCL